jgi:hypothetical protein
MVSILLLLFHKKGRGEKVREKGKPNQQQLAS